jgi:EAL domain-containing protein (putative c-di-GMP-specific phosphodiesterase class I)
LHGHVEPTPPRAEADATAGFADIDPSAILASIGEAVYDWDVTSDRISWSDAVRGVFGEAWSDEFSTGAGFAAATIAEPGRSRGAAVFNATSLDSGSGVRFWTRYAVSGPGGEPICLEDIGRWFADTAGRPVRVRGLVRRIERADARRAPPRPEPGELVGFEAFATLLAEARREAGKRRKPLALLAIEIAPAVADQLMGHYVDRSDDAAARLRAVMRARDILSRPGAGRLVALLHDCDLTQLEVAAARLAGALGSGDADARSQMRARVAGLVVPGHSQAEAIGSPLDQVLHALDECRFGGPPHLATATPDAAARPRPSRERIVADVLGALNDRRITLALQPVADARTRRPVFHEALLRMLGEDGQAVAASGFMPFAEAAGLIGALDHRALELSIAALARDPRLRLSVNVAATSLEEPAWFELLCAGALARREIASRLIIEITETAVMRDVARVREIASRVRASGGLVAIDDFGAGHTGFRQLRDLPIDFVKIDGAFIQNVERSPDDRFFVRTLVDLARHLDLKVVAEWVESEAAAAILGGLGIDYLQGDHIGRPALSAAPVSRAVAAVA